MPTDSLDDYIDAAAEALKIQIDATWKPAVRSNLEVVLQHAAKVDAFPLPDDAEPAPVFKA
jgi:1-carboxybiuret hydrolase subunit AtzG-like protein